jgi:hypothetical protein
VDNRRTIWNIDWGLIVGIAALVLAIPLGIATNILTPRLLTYLENRNLIKKNKSRQQALILFQRIKEFHEGRRDKYAHYMVLLGVSVLFAIASATVVTILLVVQMAVEHMFVFGLTAFLFLMVSVASLIGLYETSRKLDNYDEYKREFQAQWGPTDDTAS